MTTSTVKAITLKALLVLVVLATQCDIAFGQSSLDIFPDWREAQKDVDRARHWKGRGYEFDPVQMSADEMDLRVRAIERSKYWTEKGYTFDPELMTADDMDAAAERYANAFLPEIPGYTDIDLNSSFLAPIESRSNRGRVLQPVDTTMLDALDAQNRADPRSVAGSISDLAQPLLKRLGPVGRGISRGVDALEQVGDSMRGAAERGVLGGIAPKRTRIELLKSYDNSGDYVLGLGGKDQLVLGSGEYILGLGNGDQLVLGSNEYILSLGQGDKLNLGTGDYYIDLGSGDRMNLGTGDYYLNIGNGDRMNLGTGDMAIDLGNGDKLIIGSSQDRALYIDP